MKRMKLAAGFVLAFVLSLSLLSGTALAAEVVASGKCGADGSNVTWVLDSDGVLTISGEGDMGNYSIAPWTSRITRISKVVIGDGVTSIGGNAFLIADT